MKTPLIVLLLSTALIQAASMPPTPKLLNPRIVFRSPKAQSLLPAPRLVKSFSGINTPILTNLNATIYPLDGSGRSRIVILSRPTTTKSTRVSTTTKVVITTTIPFIFVTNFTSISTADEFKCTITKITPQDAYTMAFASQWVNVPEGHLTVESAHNPNGPWSVVYTDPFTYGALVFDFWYPLYLDTSPTVVFRMKVVPL